MTTDLPSWQRFRKMGDKTPPPCPPWCTSGPHEVYDAEHPRVTHSARVDGVDDALDSKVFVSLTQGWSYQDGWEAPLVYAGEMRSPATKAEFMTLHRPADVHGLAAVITAAGGDTRLVEYLGKVADRFAEILADPDTPEAGWV